jgi:hypothetical protein
LADFPREWLRFPEDSKLAGNRIEQGEIKRTNPLKVFAGAFMRQMLGRFRKLSKTKLQTQTQRDQHCGPHKLVLVRGQERGAVTEHNLKNIAHFSKTP